MADHDLIAAWERWRGSDAPARGLMAAVLEAWAAADRDFTAAGDPSAWRAAGASKWLCRRLHAAITAAEWSLPYRARRELAAAAPARLDDELAFLTLAGEDRAGERHHPAWIALLDVASAAQVAAIAAAWDAAGFATAPRVERALIEAAVRTGRLADALARLPSVRWPRDRELAVKAVAPHLDAAHRAQIVEDALAYVIAEDRLPARYLVEPAIALLELEGALGHEARLAWAELIDQVVAAMSDEEQADCPDHRDVRLQLGLLWCRLGDEPRAWSWIDRIRDDDRWTSILEMAAIASPAARELLAEEALAALGTRWASGGLDLQDLASLLRCERAIAAPYVPLLRTAPMGATRAVARVMLAAHVLTDVQPALSELRTAIGDHAQHEALLDAAEEVVTALDSLAAADIAGAARTRGAFVDLVLDGDDPFAWRDVAGAMSLDELRQLVQLAAEDLPARATDEREAIAELCAAAIERIAIDRIDAGADAVTAAAATELARELADLDVPLPESLMLSVDDRRERATRACIAHRGQPREVPGERWSTVEESPRSADSERDDEDDDVDEAVVRLDGDDDDDDDDDDELTPVPQPRPPHPSGSDSVPETVPVPESVPVPVPESVPVPEPEPPPDDEDDENGDDEPDPDDEVVLLEARPRLPRSEALIPPDAHASTDDTHAVDDEVDTPSAFDARAAEALDDDDEVELDDADVDEEEDISDEADEEGVSPPADVEPELGFLHAAFLAELEAAPLDGSTPSFLAKIRDILDDAPAHALLRAEAAMASLAASGAHVDDAFWSWLARALERTGHAAAADRVASRIGFAQYQRGVLLDLALARGDRGAIREQIRAHCAAAATYPDDPGHAAQRTATAGYLADLFAVAREQRSPTIGLFLRLVGLASTTAEQVVHGRLDLARLRAELLVAVDRARAATVPGGDDDDRLGALPLAASWVDDATARALWSDAFSAAARGRPCWAGWRADPPAAVLARVAGAAVLADLAALEARLGLAS